MDTSENGEWRQNKTVIQCNRYMLEHQINCDVWFKVGPEEERKRIGAHKYMLSARSHVFDLMFNGPMAMPTTSDILIPDIKLDVFKKLLLFIYCEDTNIDPQEAYNLRYAAEKYNLQALITRCRQRMAGALSRDSVCAILQSATTFADDKMKASCLQFISYHFKEVFESADFLELPRNCLVEILKNHDLHLPESEIFEYVLKWGKRECERLKLNQSSGPNLRYALTREILEQIRFSRMDRDYFADKVSYMDILSDEELVEVMRYFLANTSFQQQFQ